MSEPQKKRRSIVGCLMWTLCCLVLSPFVLFFGWLGYDYAIAIPADVEAKIGPDMAKQQVLDVAGPPLNDVREEIWEYRVRYPDRFGTYTDSLHVIFKNGRCVEATF